MNEVFVFIVGYVLPYITVAVLFVGTGLKILSWLRILKPSEHHFHASTRIPYGALVKEFVSFAFDRMKFDKSLWLFTLAFHIGLVLSISFHVKDWILGTVPFENVIYVLAVIASLLAIFATLGFFIRRIAIPEIRVLSSKSDTISLIFPLLPALISGLYLRIYNVISPEEVREYMLSLFLYFNPMPPDNIAFLIHFLLAQLYLMYLPFSKIHYLSGPISMLLSARRKLEVYGKYEQKALE